MRKFWKALKFMIDHTKCEESSMIRSLSISWIFLALLKRERQKKGNIFNDVLGRIIESFSIESYCVGAHTLAYIRTLIKWCRIHDKESLWRLNNCEIFYLSKSARVSFACEVWKRRTSPSLIKNAINAWDIKELMHRLSRCHFS